MDDCHFNSIKKRHLKRKLDMLWSCYKHYIFISRHVNIVWYQSNNISLVLNMSLGCYHPTNINETFKVKSGQVLGDVCHLKKKSKYHMILGVNENILMKIIICWVHIPKFLDGYECFKIQHNLWEKIIAIYANLKGQVTLMNWFYDTPSEISLWKWVCMFQLIKFLKVKRLNFFEISSV